MADEGASPREQLMEAARRNNTDLLQELLDSGSLKNNADAIAKFLNTTTDALGNSALHVAAQYGSYEVLDTILDQEGVEIDGQERRDGDTYQEEILIEDRIRNKAKMKAIDLVDPRNKELRAELQKTELQLQMGGDTVEDDEEDGRHDGPGSESD
ncbi:Ankyrin repeat-containing protein [Teratosphaeria destructans]|uniref:Ankyrin repeat-containing protein n=1 Tax=Teratosphaeria destructans TaxID=418781 RepID=A0A9W7SYP5_9PEZI|nr:Ankyrin repeat-containing protein [Teratosphaeria destructans]